MLKRRWRRRNRQHRLQRRVMALFVVAGRREGILLAWLPELAVLDLAAELGALLLVYLGLADVLGDRRRVGSGRYFVRVVVVKAGRDALFFGKLRELVVVEALRRPAVLTPVPVKLRGELVWVPSCHRTLPRSSSGIPGYSSMPPRGPAGSSALHWKERTSAAARQGALPCCHG